MPTEAGLCVSVGAGETRKINGDPGSTLKENEISTTIEGSEKLYGNSEGVINCTSA